MEWWEYLIVFVSFVSTVPFIWLQVKKAKGRMEIKKREFGLILVSLCLFLLMIITYKLFLA